MQNSYCQKWNKTVATLEAIESRIKRGMKHGEKTGSFWERAEGCLEKTYRELKAEKERFSNLMLLHGDIDHIVDDIGGKSKIANIDNTAYYCDIDNKRVVYVFVNDLSDSEKEVLQKQSKKELIFFKCSDYRDNSLFSIFLGSLKGV